MKTGIRFGKIVTVEFYMPAKTFDRYEKLAKENDTDTIAAIAYALEVMIDVMDKPHKKRKKK